MNKPTSTPGKFLHGLASIYRGFRAIVLNGLFLVALLIVVASLIGQPPVTVQNGSALLLDLNGVLVDQRTYVDPLSTLMADSLDADVPREILLQDVLDAIDCAAKDPAISSIVLIPHDLAGSGFSKLQDIAAALIRFRDSGKKVYAYGDNYSQGQYYLAAHADEVILNNMGSVSLEGFSSYQYYYREALDKLGINVHIFRVGEYKSAVEPFERNDMSTQAREANSDWLGDLWQLYLADISAARAVEPGFFHALINNLDRELADFAGDATALALNRNLVDTVLSRDATIDHLIGEIGADFTGDDFLSIDYRNYLAARETAFANLQSQAGQIGIIVASGTIYDGSREAGEIGGDSLQRLIRKVREDDRISALVLRIDSGGGSAFASEIIRDELAGLRRDGKPLVVSMGSVAASGGYWIATPANEIWASASTITGSIGIFGLYPTFADSFSRLGLNTDGVGTTDLAGAFMVGRDLPPLAANILQQQLEDGYNRFISLVAESRNMSLEAVDEIARGRVWSGADAQALGLVDHLGGLDNAIAAAASLAGLEDYRTQLIEAPLTPGEQLLQNLAGNATLQSWLPQQPMSLPTALPATSALGRFYRRLNADLRALVQFNDPKGLYLHCLECQGTFSP